MSRSSAWLRGTIVRKSGLPSSSHSTRSSTPAQPVASTSTTAFGGGVKDATGKVSEYSSMEDQCPVCKSDRYLNPKLRLLVSACYHKMCESCIDRLFTLGPAPCPICNKTLRKLAFMPQTFEDLTVEKEVSVRRRLAKDFNKHREDFPDMKAYNDYLEEVEDITFNLINDIDVPETEERVIAFRRENAAVIEANIQRDESYAASLREKEELDRQRREERARTLAREEEDARSAREADRRELIDTLENSSTDARALVRRQREKERERRERELERERERQAGQSASAASVLRARAAQSVIIPDTPHVPLQDDWYAYEDKYALRADAYFDPMSEAVRQDREGIMRGGGYIVEEAWERALRSAVAGLDLMPLTGLRPSVAPPTASSGGDVVMASV
ncbi:CDK-activating kinase assembly factor [Phellopilus nigrolimitatus]|nr:CDK-activating kinase assembly factor [Phellopilus nigrolimitatus]